jgi:hypothetical protein
LPPREKPGIPEMSTHQLNLMCTRVKKANPHLILYRMRLRIFQFTMEVQFIETDFVFFIILEQY